jgi:hypothetical protein
MYAGGVRFGIMFWVLVWPVVDFWPQLFTLEIRSGF